MSELLLLALILCVAVVLTVSDEDCTTCCAEPVLVCDCEVAHSTLTLAGFTDAADKYASFAASSTACVGSLPAYDDCTWFQSGASPPSFACNVGASAQNYGHITDRCMLSNLNGSYQTSDIVPGVGGAAVTHYLGTDGSTTDRGVLVRELEYEFLGCCTDDEDLDEAACEVITPTVALRVYARTYCWKIEYGLQCITCADSESQWITPLDSFSNTARIEFYYHTVYDWEAVPCNWYWLNLIWPWIDETITEPATGSATSWLGIPGSVVGPSMPGTCDHQIIDWVDMYVVHPGFNASCLSLLELSEEDCCSYYQECNGCVECSGCLLFTELASIHPDCVGKPNLTATSGCQLESLTLTGSVELG